MNNAIKVLALLSIAAGTTARSAEPEGTPFLEEVKRLTVEHKAVMQKSSQFAREGYAGKGNELLLALAEPNGKPAHWFFVGNMLYRSDTNASYRLHKRAYQAEPKEAFVALEWAMEQHRRGEYKGAIPLYQWFLEKTGNERMNALLADCLLREGKLADAVKAWNAAAHGRNHTSIDFSIYEIYGALLPTQRRSDLLTEVVAGDVNALEDLILLDAHFDYDWWNTDVNRGALEIDLKLAAQKLGTNGARYKAIEAYCKLKRNDDYKADDVKKILSDSGFLLPSQSKLPESPKMTRALLELAVFSKAETAKALLDMHEQGLTARVKSATADRDALHALCLICSEAGNGRTSEFARYGWEQWGETAFAASFLAEALAKGTLKPDDRDLVAALKKAPEDNVLNMIRIQACNAAKTEPTMEMIVAAIKAEYRRLSTGLVIPDSYTLKGLFAALEKKLK